MAKLQNMDLSLSIEIFKLKRQVWSSKAAITLSNMGIRWKECQTFFYFFEKGKKCQTKIIIIK